MTESNLSEGCHREDRCMHRALVDDSCAQGKPSVERDALNMLEAASRSKFDGYNVDRRIMVLLQRLAYLFL